MCLSGDYIYQTLLRVPYSLEVIENYLSEKNLKIQPIVPYKELFLNLITGTSCTLKSPFLNLKIGVCDTQIKSYFLLTFPLGTLDRNKYLNFQIRLKSFLGEVRNVDVRIWRERF